MTSKMEGYKDRSIFLPSAGFFIDSSLNYDGSSGSYWTSLIGGDNGKSAHTLTWYGGNKNVYSYNQYYPFNTYTSNAVLRYMGRPVRAVAVQTAPRP